jgi:hypothetical protein
MTGDKRIQDTIDEILWKINEQVAPLLDRE